MNLTKMFSNLIAIIIAAVFVLILIYRDRYLRNKSESKKLFSFPFAAILSLVFFISLAIVTDSASKLLALLLQIKSLIT